VVFNTTDFKGVAEVMDVSAVIADPKAELERFNVLKALYVSIAGVDELGQNMEDAQDRGIVDGAELDLDRRLARSSHPPCTHPGDERRQPPPQAEPLQMDPIRPNQLRGKRNRHRQEQRGRAQSAMSRRLNSRVAIPH